MTDTARLDAMARFHVTVYTPGMDDRLDQLCSSARIRALPPEEKEYVRQAIAAIVANGNAAYGI